MFTVLVLFFCSACHLQFRRALRTQDEELIVEVGLSSQRELRAKHARALARALVAEGESEKARAILLRDFRRGGENESLLQLADLEASLGLNGIAVAHYARVINLEPELLEDRGDVCIRLAARARVRSSQGEWLAADADLRRAEKVCKHSDEYISPEKRQEISARAEEENRILDQPMKKQVEQLLTKARYNYERQLARSKGPQEFLLWARSFAGELDSKDIRDLLRAEFWGELAPLDLYSTDLENWIAGRTPEVVTESFSSLSKGERAYAALRLAQLSSVFVLDRASQQAMLLDAVAESTSQRWRAWKAAGDLTMASFELNRQYGKLARRIRDRSFSTASRVTVPQFGALLALAEIWAQQAKLGESLALRRALFELVFSEKQPSASTVLLDLIRNEIKQGRPWIAWALAGAGPRSIQEKVERPLASFLALREIVCPDCDDPGEAEALRFVMGERWLQEQGVNLLGSFASQSSHTPGGGWCGGQRNAVSLLGDREQPTSKAIRKLILGQRNESIRNVLARGLEQEVGMSCIAPLSLSALMAGGYRLTVQSSGERLAQSEFTYSSSQMEYVGTVAAALGDVDRAELWMRAAGARSLDPSGFWRRVAVTARYYRSRELERSALGHYLGYLLAQAGPDGLSVAADEAVGALINARIQDLSKDPYLIEGYPYAMEALSQQLSDYLEGSEPRLRWKRSDSFLAHLFVATREERASSSRISDFIWSSGVFDEEQHSARSREWRGEVKGIKYGRNKSENEYRLCVEGCLQRDERVKSALWLASHGQESSRALALTFLWKDTLESGMEKQKEAMLEFLFNQPVSFAAVSENHDGEFMIQAGELRTLVFPIDKIVSEEDSNTIGTSSLRTAAREANAG